MKQEGRRQTVLRFEWCN